MYLPKNNPFENNRRKTKTPERKQPVWIQKYSWLLSYEPWNFQKGIASGLFFYWFSFKIRGLQATFSVICRKMYPFLDDPTFKSNVFCVPFWSSTVHVFVLLFKQKIYQINKPFDHGQCYWFHWITFHKNVRFQVRLYPWKFNTMHCERGETRKIPKTAEN